MARGGYRALERALREEPAWVVDEVLRAGLRGRGGAGFSTGKETVSAEYPFLIVTGRDLYQFNAGTMTARTDNIVLRPRDVLDQSKA